jgi:hypothetical protein
MLESKNSIWDIELAANASAKEVEDYIRARIKDYEDDNITRSDLFDMWKEDFAGFTKTTFGKHKEATKAL